MNHKKIIENIINYISGNDNFLSLAVGGSWITNEIDEYSDLDLILVTHERVSDDPSKMISIANEFGDLLNAFTGEHVGEPRLLICLFDNPLLHVDIKFIVLDEFNIRVEDPEILWEKEECLSQIISKTKAEWPKYDPQWIEDRFWIWIHYATLKLGRGEYFEAFEFLSFLRTSVIAPLFQIKNGLLPRGVRKVEINFPESDFDLLKQTIADYDARSIIIALKNIINIYLDLSSKLFSKTITTKNSSKKRSLEYLNKIENKIEISN